MGIYGTKKGTPYCGVFPSLGRWETESKLLLLNIIDLCWPIVQLVNGWQNKWKVVEKWMAVGGWRNEMELWTCFMVVDVPEKTWHCFAETWCYVSLHCIIVSASFLPNPVASWPILPLNHKHTRIPCAMVWISWTIIIYTKQISHKNPILAKNTYLCEKHMVSWVSCRY